MLRFTWQVTAPSPRAYPCHMREIGYQHFDTRVWGDKPNSVVWYGTHEILHMSESVRLSFRLSYLILPYKLGKIWKQYLKKKSLVKVFLSKCFHLLTQKNCNADYVHICLPYLFTILPTFSLKETTTRTIGEQTHTITEKQHKGGEQEKSENFINMDQRKFEILRLFGPETIYKYI